MSEERPKHSQEPAEGGEDQIEAPFAQRAGDPGNPETVEDAGKRSAEHPQEPAEGGEDAVEAPGVQKSGDDRGEDS